MTLPKNERQTVGATNFMKGWIYGAPFSGKTTFLDKAPDPLNLNTDGNTKYVTMQRIFIRDEVTTTGRITLCSNIKSVKSVTKVPAGAHFLYVVKR